MERIVACIPPTLDGWVYIDPIHGPLDGPLYTWAQYTPTVRVYPTISPQKINRQVRLSLGLFWTRYNTGVTDVPVLGIQT